MKHKDPFLGEIELTKLGETSINAMGESQVNTIYSDERGNYYVDTWNTGGGDMLPMMFLRKELVDKINELQNNNI